MLTNLCWEGSEFNPIPWMQTPKRNSGLQIYSQGLDRWNKSGFNSFILHLVNMWHWAHYFSLWVFIHKREMTLPCSQNKMECLIQSRPWVNYSSIASFLWPCVDVTLLIWFVFSSDHPQSISFLLKFHFLKKPSLSPKHSKNNMERASSTASTEHSG